MRKFAGILYFVLILEVAVVLTLEDSVACKADNADENNEETCLIEEEKANEKSTLLESHSCEFADYDDDYDGTCVKKDNRDEEDNESVLVSQMHIEEEKDDDDQDTVCRDGQHKESKCSLINEENIDEGEDISDLVPEKSLSDLVPEKSQDEDTEEKDQKIIEDVLNEEPELVEQEYTLQENEIEPPLIAQVESPEEVNKDNQNSESGSIPLREILMKLKPEGFTDNEDEQPGDYSVTEASMGDDGEVEEECLVSSGSEEKQESDIESISEASKNGSTSSGISKKAICEDLNSTDIVQDVEIINATMLMKLLQGNPNITNRSSAAPCHLIYFFSPYCPFSVAGSPYVNGMARSIKNIPVYGMDSIEYHSVNARYGVMGTPTLLLFHNGNAVGRYNASEFSVLHLLNFINHYTDQTITDINVTSSDFRATLPSNIAESRPYGLWVSWIFLLSCASWLFITSDLCARVTEAILNNWREAEAQNDQD